MFFIIRMRLAGKKTNDVEKLLGHEPITLRQYIEDYKHLWN